MPVIFQYCNCLIFFLLIVCSPIKERSNEGTHSSLENRTADPSHHTNSHYNQVSSKQLLIADPFCKEHQKKVFANLSEPIDYHNSYHYLNEDLPILQTNFQVTIGECCRLNGNIFGKYKYGCMV